MIATRVVAQLTADSNLRARREKGSFGELRVAIDGVDVFAANALWYPTPSTVIAKIRSHLKK
jgi:hypothetical protein